MTDPLRGWNADRPVRARPYPWRVSSLSILPWMVSLPLVAVPSAGPAWLEGAPLPGAPPGLLDGGGESFPRDLGGMICFGLLRRHRLFAAGRVGKMRGLG